MSLLPDEDEINKIDAELYRKWMPRMEKNAHDLSIYLKDALNLLSDTKELLEDIDNITYFDADITLAAIRDFERRTKHLFVLPDEFLEPVFVVGLIMRDNQVLAVSRKTNHQDLGLPGGKIELNEFETPEEALKREVFEETGLITVKFEHCFDRVTFENSSKIEICRCFKVLEWLGDPTSKEGAWVGWVPPSRLLEESCSFREYNKSLFEALNIEL